jgi:copper chaperone CopZ
MTGTTTYSLTVTGMHCGSCGMLIDETLEETTGVHRSQTTVRAGRTVVDVDAAIADPDTLIAVIGSLGYTARLDPP